MLTLFVKASRRAKGMGVTERAIASAVANPCPTARGKKNKHLAVLILLHMFGDPVCEFYELSDAKLLGAGRKEWVFCPSEVPKDRLERVS